MATHKSAEKRHRQSLLRRERNRSTRAACRTVLKATRAAVTSGDLKLAQEELKRAEKRLASAAAKGLYPKQSAARKISRIAKFVAQAVAAKA